MMAQILCLVVVKESSDKRRGILVETGYGRD